MGFNPFDFLGTDKRKKVNPKIMGLAKNVIGEYKLREKVREIINDISKDITRRS